MFASLVLAQDSGESKDGTNPQGNSLLKQLFDDDQADRKDGTIDADTVKRDAARRERVLIELRAGKIRTASDHYHAAMVFQHGESADEIRLAFSLAWMSAQMDSKIRIEPFGSRPPRGTGS